MTPPSPVFDICRGDGEIRTDLSAALPGAPVQYREPGRYMTEPELAEAVNIAIAVSQPLLLTGEPGCGKTRLAWSIADELGLGEPLEFHAPSTSRTQDLLYHFDAVRRFYDIQAKDERATDPRNYVTYGALGRAIVGGGAPGRADRRDRQGAPRLPQRPPRRVRSDALRGGRAGRA